MFLFLGIILCGAVHAQVKKIKGTGYLLVQERTSDKPFTKISVQQGITVYLGQGFDHGFTIEADDNIITHIQTEVRDGQLNVFIAPGIEITRFAEMNVSVSMPRVTDITVASAARLIGSTPLKEKKLEVVVSGAGIVKLDVEVDELDVEAASAAKLELKGRADTLDLEMSTAAVLKANELRVVHCEAEVSGAAKAEVFVSGTLGVQISSAGLLLYDGNPRITKQNVSGRGALQRRKRR